MIEFHFNLYNQKKIALKTAKNDKACWHEALNKYEHVHAFSVHLSLLSLGYFIKHLTNKEGQRIRNFWGEGWVKCDA